MTTHDMFVSLSQTCTSKCHLGVSVVWVRVVLQAHGVGVDSLEVFCCLDCPSLFLGAASCLSVTLSFVPRYGLLVLRVSLFE